jgi:hypothetical protein
MLLQQKKKKLKFKRQFIPLSEESYSPDTSKQVVASPFLINQSFEFLSGLRNELDRLIWEYSEMRNSLETTTGIIKQFHFVVQGRHHPSSSLDRREELQKYKESMNSTSIGNINPVDRKQEIGEQSPTFYGALHHDTHGKNRSNRSKSFNVTPPRSPQKLPSATVVQQPGIVTRRNRSRTDRVLEEPDDELFAYDDSELEKSLEEFSKPVLDKVND